MINRQFYTYKFKSSRLKEFNYNIDISFDEAKELKEIIGLADSQILRSIRDIRKKFIDYEKLELLYSIRDKLKKKVLKNKDNSRSEKIKSFIVEKFIKTGKTNSYIQKSINKYCKENDEYRDLLCDIQSKINRTMFIPDYITVVMEHPKHYEYIYKNGIIINGKTYKRFSCSAGQARVSTVVLCNTEIIDELRKRLYNGIDTNVKIAPSKFNAYFGLAGSATKIVSEPKFIVVKDFENTTKFMANYVIETDWDKDDIIEQRMIEDFPMNRTDGMGLISPKQSEKWAKELDLDWIPSQWCIRQNFIKGMLCTFDIHKFCEEINGGNYIVDTIYKEENGEYIKADLREYDVILSESQFKLWENYSDINIYIENCRKNKLYWGISQYTPKEAKDILKLNYQFIQTLNLNQLDIEKLCSQFVDWISGVSYDNFAYMLLFLLGVNNTESKIKDFLNSGKNYWIKSLIANPEVKNDKYIRTKIRELLKTKIQNGCMGDIFVDGNFQVLVYDPYGFMQHVCGQEVTGLLKEGEFYSNYWNERNIDRVDGMRSPLTYRSEHVVLNLVKNKDTEKWYQYCKLGIILNYHGHEVVNFGGADVDFDILATTSNSQIINGVYKNELPVVYDPPKPNKIIFTEDDLYRADTFSFGSIIGSITNKSSNAYALLPNIECTYGTDSEEYKITISRLQQCCKAQSAQIDKAKIGREVKGIPSIWVNKQNLDINENGEVLDTEEDIKYKELHNRILINKYPYFFKYRYKHCKKSYDKYVDENEVTCHQRFKMSLKKLFELDRHTIEQKEFIDNYYKHMPVVISNSPMNLLCRYIEGINFNISQNIKSSNCTDLIDLYKNKKIEYSEDKYNEVIEVLESHIKNKQFDKMMPSEDDDDISKFDKESVREYEIDNNTLEEKLNQVSSNAYLITNCLIDYFYVENPSKNKDILWSTYGKYIFINIKNNTSEKAKFPFPQENGSIIYMGKAYELKEVNLN